MMAIIISVTLLTVVLLGAALDKRAARRREDENFELGRIVERGFGRLTQHEKDMMLADVMADHHERKLNVKDRNWRPVGVVFLAMAVIYAVAVSIWWES